MSLAACRPSVFRCLISRVQLTKNIRFWSSERQTTIYELRTYLIQPSKFVSFLGLTQEHLHLRTNHSRLIGYWTTEFGGINEVVHLWEYDRYSHRAGVRKALSKDQNWLETYLSKAAPMMTSMSNVVMYPLPWCCLSLQPKGDSNIYELTCTSIAKGRVPQWEHRIQQGWSARLKYSKPVGLFRSYYGPLDNVYQLWVYDSFDHQKEVSEQAMADEDWRETDRDLALFTSSTWRKGLVPVGGVSPLK